MTYLSVVGFNGKSLASCKLQQATVLSARICFMSDEKFTCVSVSVFVGPEQSKQIGCK